MTSDADRIADRIATLEVKLAWQDETIADLNLALVDKEKRVSALEDHVARLERALQILADRQRQKIVEVAGIMDVDDPVPRSG